MTPAERAREIVLDWLQKWGAPNMSTTTALLDLESRVAAALAAQGAQWEEVGRTQVEAAKWLDCHPARIDLYAKLLREKYDAQAAQTRALREALEELASRFDNASRAAFESAQQYKARNMEKAAHESIAESSAYRVAVLEVLAALTGAPREPHA